MSLNLWGSVPYPVGLTAWEQMMLDSTCVIDTAAPVRVCQLVAAFLDFFSSSTRNYIFFCRFLFYITHDLSLIEDCHFKICPTTYAIVFIKIINISISEAHNSHCYYK